MLNRLKKLAIGSQGIKGRSLHIETLEDRCMLAFVHPGLLHTEADFDRITEKLAVQAEPWHSSFQVFTSEGYAQLGANPRPLETVIRGGDGNNVAQMYIDIQRSYLLAVRWQLTGDTAYADKAVEFLNAWQYTMTNLTGNSDRFLAAGIYGYEWANVAEIMRSYEGWSETDSSNFGTWLELHYYQKNHDFLTSHNGAAITNYWANWDLANISSMMAIGIYTDNQAMYDEALDYLYDGAGNGALDKFVYYVHDGNLGQWQEAGRDQGHTLLGISLVGPIMQMVWNQGDDLFSYDNNRFLAGAEYVAKYNLGEEVPYTTYNWGTGQSGAWRSQTEVSSAGRGGFVPGYELVYNHYANIKGIDLPYTEQVVGALAPEGWDRRGDQFGFGTLLYTLDAFPEENSKPTGLTAVNYDGSVKLNWWGAVYADSHNVYRSTSAGGVYELIATGLTDQTTYVDYGMLAGQYFYKVKGVVDGVETDASDVVQIDTAPELVAHLTFDEGSGVVAMDSTGNGTNGTLEGNATWVPGVEGSAIDLSGGGQHVELPEDILEDYSDYTISTWVNLDNVSTWSRIFDFGNSDGHYMFLTPQAGSGKVRFAIATVFGYNENIIEGEAALPTGEWVHVAVTQAGTVGKLYVNGEMIGINDQMPLNALQLGSTNQNWIGRSQYEGDAYLDGRVDDFRIYSGALTAGAIYEQATGTAAPATPAAPASLNAQTQIGNEADLTWLGSRGADYYAVKLATSIDGPFYTIKAITDGNNAFTDTNLTAGETYYYVVVAVNDGGESSLSSAAAVTALPDLPGIPSEVTANALSGSELQISWSNVSLADNYSISRSETTEGPFTTIATGVVGTSYADNTVATGVAYYYTVTAENAAGASDPSAIVSASASDLFGWWKLDESAGSIASDSLGGGRDGTLVGGGTWSTGRIDNGLLLDGVDDYVDLPGGVVSGLTDFSISLWTKGGSNTTWARLFDFGTGTNNFMFLTPISGSNGNLRFEMVSGGVVEQINTSATISSRGWSHVVVTMENGVGVIYLNGNEVGRNSSMTLTPADLGATTQNYLGKSQWSADPYCSGVMDDFRILNRALSQGEIQAMFNLPSLLGDYNGNGAVDAADYTVWRDALGSSVPAYSGADGNGNGLIDQADYAQWVANYGMTTTVSLATSIASDDTDSLDNVSVDVIAKLGIEEVSLEVASLETMQSKVVEVEALQPVTEELSLSPYRGRPLPNAFLNSFQSLNSNLLKANPIAEVNTQSMVDSTLLLTTLDNAFVEASERQDDEYEFDFAEKYLLTDEAAKAVEEQLWPVIQTIQSVRSEGRLLGARNRETK